MDLSDDEKLAIKVLNTYLKRIKNHEILSIGIVAVDSNRNEACAYVISDDKGIIDRLKISTHQLMDALTETHCMNCDEFHAGLICPQKESFADN